MELVDDALLSLMQTQKGENVFEISKNQPVFLVFLRHFGCQFCREAMDELSKLLPALEKENMRLVFVHMSDHKIAEEYFKKFNLPGVSHVSDPTCHFYTAFGLIKGTITQLFGLQSWFRGFSVQAKFGAEMGKHLGDSFQMPGAFVVSGGKIRDSFVHKLPSDRPDYKKLLACCEIKA
jgi:peroxiredoxin